MTQTDIFDMAKQAGFPTNYNDTTLLHGKEIQAFAELVAAKEREECVRRAHIALLGTLESTAGRVIHAIQTRGEA
jgi:hypothetical protein